MNQLRELLHRLTFALFVAIAFPACAARVAVKIGEVPHPKVPTVTDVENTEAIMDEILPARYQESTSPNNVQRVKRIVNALEVAAGYSAGTFPVYLFDAGDEVNAMAVNGTSLVVLEGLLRNVRSDDELAVVLSHEVGHILAEHSKDKGKEQRSTLVRVGSSLFGAIASVAASAAGLSGASRAAERLARSTTQAIGYGALVGRFDRDQEYEADHIGLMLMAKAGYNPEVALGFWARASEVFGHKHSQLSAFFSTHPSFGDRERALREALPLALAHYRPDRKNEAKREPRAA